MKWRVLASCMTLAWLAGCGAAGSDGQGEVAVLSEQPGVGPSVGTPNPNPGLPSTPSTSSMGPDFDVSEDGDGSLAPMGCQQAERNFVPNIPTVYLLVDRSGTMFDPIIDNVSAWTALRGGVLEVMRELETSVRFGFAAFAGATLSGQMCDLQVPSVAPKLNNYADIAALYEPLEKPLNPNEKETPTTLALQRIASELRADNETPGDKYILFVTDGEPDYCDNGNQLCPPDSVVGLLQKLSSGIDPSGAPAAPIRTLVFGVSSPTASIRADVLQAFANAGAGLPVMAVAQNANQVPVPTDLYDQCNGVPGWRSDFLATGKPDARGQGVGDYVFDPALAGTAPVYRPDPTDQAALTEQLRVALAGVKSCTFDLGEDGVQVDLARRDLGQLARVLINEQPVVYDAANGWSMMSETTVALTGTACEAWRNPVVATTIRFDFPCDIFVPR